MKKHQRMWLDFCQFLSAHVQEDLTKYYLYRLICEWLTKNRKGFIHETWEWYRVEKYIAYESSDYPMEYSEDSVREIIDRMRHSQPSSRETIAMFIVGILWDMVAYKSSIQCSNCRDDAYRVLYDEKRKQLVLSCDLCAYSQFEDGKKWQGDNYLVPAKIPELKALNYLD